MWRKVSAAPARRHHHAGELRELRQQLRGGLDHALRVVGVQLALELVDLAALERLDHQQRVDEEAVAARRRHAAGRGVRARDEAQLLQVRHHVADAWPATGRGRSTSTARASRPAGPRRCSARPASSAGSARACRAWNSLYTRRMPPAAKRRSSAAIALIGKYAARRSRRRCASCASSSRERGCEVLDRTGETPAPTSPSWSAATAPCSPPRATWCATACRWSASTRAASAS